MKFRLITLLYVSLAAAILVSLLQVRTFEIVAAIVHLGLLSIVYYLVRSSKYSIALTMLTIYLLLWAVTSYFGVPQLSHHYTSLRFENVGYPRSEFLSDQGVSSFENVRSPCALLVTIDVVAVSPLGNHGGFAGTDRYLWLFGWTINVGRTIQASIR